MPAAKPSLSANATRVLAAPREQVFAAFTDPEALKRWWITAEGTQVVEVKMDVKTGGAWHIRLTDALGDPVVVGGVYREVRRPEKLIYTWRWQGNMDIGESIVTVEFKAVGTSTEVSIIHEGLPSDHQVQFHTWGWTKILEGLSRLF